MNDEKSEELIIEDKNNKPLVRYNPSIKGGRDVEGSYYHARYVLSQARERGAISEDLFEESKRFIEEVKTRYSQRKNLELIESISPEEIQEALDSLRGERMKRLFG